MHRTTHKVLPSFAVAIAIAMSASLTDRAGAMSVTSPSGIAAAIEDLIVIHQVHCVPGWPHHVPTAVTRRDGCLRRRVVVPPAVVVVPPAVVVPARRWCHRWRTTRNFRC
jgi:hypothetical protein